MVHSALLFVCILTLHANLLGSLFVLCLYCILPTTHVNVLTWFWRFGSGVKILQGHVWFATLTLSAVDFIYMCICCSELSLHVVL